MKTAHEIFEETLSDLGFSGYKPDEMSNRDYWLCTLAAMERYASQSCNKQNKSVKDFLRILLHANMCSHSADDLINNYLKQLP